MSTKLLLLPAAKPINESAMLLCSLLMYLFCAAAVFILLLHFMLLLQLFCAAAVFVLYCCCVCFVLLLILFLLLLCFVFLLSFTFLLCFALLLDFVMLFCFVLLWLLCDAVVFGVSSAAALFYDALLLCLYY